MSHMVIYRGTDGKPAYHEVEEIHDAVAFVEQLRNEQGVEHATIHRMEQVTFEYRPYFRVELRGANQLNSAPAPAPAAVAAAPAAPMAPPPEVSAPPAVEPVSPTPEVINTTPPSSTETADAGEADGVGARRGLFGR